MFQTCTKENVSAHRLYVCMVTALPLLGVWTAAAQVGFTLCLSDARGVAVWAAFELTPEMLHSVAGRRQGFRWAGSNSRSRWKCLDRCAVETPKCPARSSQAVHGATFVAPSKHTTNSARMASSRRSPSHAGRPNRWAWALSPGTGNSRRSVASIHFIDRMFETKDYGMFREL